MTDFDDLSPDELAGARFDSELSDEDAARVDADPDLARQVQTQAAVSERLQAAPTPPPPASMRDQHLAAALAAFDEMHSGDTSLVSDASEGDLTPKRTESPEAQTPPPPSLRDARERRRSIGPWLMSAAAAILALVALFGLVNRSDDGDETATGASSDGSASDEASDGAAGDDADDAARNESAPVASEADIVGDPAESPAGPVSDFDDETMAQDDGTPLEDASSSPDASAAADASDGASNGDAGGGDGEASGSETSVSHAAGDDASGDEDFADDAMTGDGAEDGAEYEGETGLSMPFEFYFDPDSLAPELAVLGLPCLAEITALEREAGTTADASDAPTAKQDPDDPAITVFLFRTVDGEPSAAYAVREGSCEPIDQERFG